ncbi:MAG: F0F1 ATP synthase subunit epsilon [Clostridia bacterium]|nr:F0F1 ATP synthase subunit epsilon [Clostridia bacterium]
MSDKKLKLNIVTPNRSFYDGDASAVIVKTIDGEVGILPNHQPLVSVLDIGMIDIKNDSDIKSATINMGFIQVVDNEVSIFTDSAEWPDEIDLDRAKAARERAEQRLKEKSDDLDFKRAELALKRAINRIGARESL